MQELNITITAAGEVTVDVQGMNGTNCLELTRALEARLGVVLERQLKPEFYQTVHEVNQVWNQSS